MPIHGYPGNVVTANPTSPTADSASGVWTLEQQLQAQAAGNWPQPPLQISRSLRFNSADSAYLNRTNGSSPTSDKICTWNFWLKNTQQTANAWIVGTGDSPNSTHEDNLVLISATQTLYCELGNGGGFQTTQVFRDPSAWYMVTVAYDTTQATSTNRIKVYVNGVQVTAFSSITYPTQNSILNFGSTKPTSIGRRQYSVSNYFNGYLTEINFIDGSALDPTSFGEFNEDTGVWQPKRYTGTYGTNGFYLDFADNTSTTTLGYDAAGSNDWTLNNFSVTAGAGNDSLVDTPTNYGTDTGVGGQVRGNYATLNPLNKNTSGTLSNGNLEWQASTTAVQAVTGTSSIIPGGKTYYEVNVVTAAGAGTYFQVGIVPFGKSLTTAIGNASGNGYSIEQNQADDIQLRLNGTSVTVSTVVQTGDVLQVAIDHATGKLWFGRNNTWYNSSGGTTGNPGAGTNETATISTSADWFPAVAKYNTGGSYAINFGQRPFAYTAPSGFKALCTQNLPEPTIVDGGEYFNTVLYTGDDSGSRSITGVGFQPDLVWLKSRSLAYAHNLCDAVRGVEKTLSSNATSAENYAGTGDITAFNADGFSIRETSNWEINNNGSTYVAWNWKANGAGVSNTDGTITSTVSANTDSGFSIVTYTGTKTSSGSDTIGHGLGVAPSMIIVKRRNDAYDWPVGLSVLGWNSTDLLMLNTTGAKGAVGWNDFGAAPTSTVFTVSYSNRTNISGGTFVAYCFAAIPGYSAFGSYVGNGSADGPFVYTGFRPRYVMIKIATGDTGQWVIYDTARDPYNAMDLELQAESSNAENQLGSNPIDCLSNGFKIRSTTLRINRNTSTFIYMAFAENPFKLALAR